MIYYCYTEFLSLIKNNYNMKNYLENTLRQKVDIKENMALYKKLPLVFKSSKKWPKFILKQ